MKERPKLKSKFEERVQEAVKYANTIEDFDELVDPRTFVTIWGQSLLTTSSVQFIRKRGSVSYPNT